MAAAWRFGWTPLRNPAERTLRVGADQAPPYYYLPGNAPEDGGSVRGFAVDVLNEAARRAGILLEWVPVQRGLDASLSEGLVDLWPVAGITETRRARLHFSEPWVDNEFVLVELGDSPGRTPADSSGRFPVESLSHARLPITTALAGHLIRARSTLITATREEAIEAVCTSRASAAFVEERYLHTILLQRPEACARAQFRFHHLPGAALPHALATRAGDERTRRLSEELRQRISEMAADGTLPNLLDRWAPSTSNSIRTLLAHEASQRRNRALSLTSGGLAFSVLCLAYLYRRSARNARLLALAHKELSAGQERWRMIVESSGEGIFEWNPEEGSVYLSPQWKSLLGYRDEELPNRVDTWERLIHPEDEHCVRDEAERYLRGETPRFETTYRMRHKDGSYRRFRSRAQAVPGASGKEFRWVGSIRPDENL